MNKIKQSAPGTVRTITPAKTRRSIIIPIITAAMGTGIGLMPAGSLATTRVQAFQKLYLLMNTAAVRFFLLHHTQLTVAPAKNPLISAAGAAAQWKVLVVQHAVFLQGRALGDRPTVAEKAAGNKLRYAKDQHYTPPAMAGTGRKTGFSIPYTGRCTLVGRNSML